MFADSSIDEITAADLLGEYPSIRYAPPDGTFYVDILTRLGEACAFADLQTERVPFDGLTATVVTPETRYRMKHEEGHGASEGSG